MRVRALAGVAPLLALMVGCGSDGGGGSSQKFDASFATDGGGAGGDGGQTGDGGPNGGMGGGGGQRLRMSYVKKVQFRDGTPGRTDLYVYDFQDNQQFNLTSGAAAGVVDCATKACKLTSDMRWVSWLATDPAGGFALWVAPVDVTRKEVQVDRKRKVDDQVNAFDFAGDQIVYTRGQAMGGMDGTEIRTEPIAGPAGDCDPDPAANQGKPTCQQVVESVDANGGFRVTPFGSLIIALRTTLSSMTIDFFNITNGLNQSLYTFGSQMGTGSQFDGRQPVGLSPDATYLAVFTRNDLIWRLNTLEARPNPPDPATKDLFELKSNPAGDCRQGLPHTINDHGTPMDDQVFFNKVLFNPRFSNNGDYIYFLASGDCSRRDQTAPLNRDDYDIIRVTRDLQTFKNVTNNPRLNEWSNHDIGDFDLTPDASLIAFTASRPNDTDSRSIWLLHFDGNTATYDCSRGSARQDAYGNTHCEFIFDDIANAYVTHSNVTFHQVSGN
jgi:hypothetical protein